MSNGNGPTEPWQLTLGRYFIQQLPTIITAAALAVGGCYESRRLHEGQQQTHEKLDEHGQELRELKSAVEKEKP